MIFSQKSVKKLEQEGNMAENKKEDTERKTKGGMLAENDDSTAGKIDSTETRNESDSTPKISKETAEGLHDDRPLH
jgi:hypothetical protein